ncbi:MAG: nitroreductase [Omnitrophica WOR_2 bacterium GWF2_43_52]|nr:MAG: nitroreductase [Omnitrophica WOR_2 bacterium GWA2_44_7]OGX21900.1 MAG: nitroreductase [Omnitrophica WOR_2 bacterium GWF2_43_52]HAH20162.1 nitroreductase [Candidatus Omnitrophota bacterium]HBG63058.1 nitroreductase [Candidatus Omnitrophota bacterium]HCD37150.1 nitroreductase [Candidatus Omnitrophota bacterium]
MSSSEIYLSKNDTLRSVKNRRSVRMFLDKLVSDDDLQAILHAANHAPSAHNQQSWRFVVLKGKKKNELANLINAKADSFPKPSCVLLRLASRSIVSAPVVIAVANSGELISRGTELFKVDKDTAHDFFRIMEIQSSAAAVENLLIAATSLELSAVWLGVLVLIKDDILQFIGEPAGEFMAVIPVGYAAKAGEGPRKRSLDMVVKYLEQ